MKHTPPATGYPSYGKTSASLEQALEHRSWPWWKKHITHRKTYKALERERRNRMLTNVYNMSIFNKKEV